MSRQNDITHLVDMVQQGKMTADEANVYQMRMDRVRLVTGRIPAGVRRALNAAVKRGELGHKKKDGHKPEAYYHPEFEFMVHGERMKHDRSVLMALAGVMANTHGA